MRQVNKIYFQSAMIAVGLFCVTQIFAFQVKFNLPELSPKMEGLFTFDDGRPFPADSTYLHHLDSEPSPTERVKAFAISDLELERKKSQSCSKQYFKFESVSAKISNDTLILTFTNTNKYSSTTRNKLLEVAVTKDGSTAGLYHSCSKKRILEEEDGSTKVVPVLKSEVEDLEITLNTLDFKKDAVLKGSIEMKSIYISTSRSARKTSEKITGNFRCIIE